MSNTKLYRVIYNDQSYLDYELTEDEYNLLWHLIAGNKRFLKFQYGILLLQDIRAVIEAKLPEEEDSGQAPPDSPQAWIEWERQQREREVDEDIDY